MSEAVKWTPSLSTANSDGRTPSITPECEIQYEGTKTLQLKQHCTKHPGHAEFIPVNDLTMDKLPPEWQTQKHLDFIRSHCDLTVRISVRYTSPNRPDTIPDSNTPYPYTHMKGQFHAQRLGTGSIVRADSYRDSIKGSICPCRICKTSEHPKKSYWEVDIQTSSHVVFDASEAAQTEVQCFYDSDDTQGQWLYGVHTNQSGIQTDQYTFGDHSTLTCVTHDMRLGETLNGLWKKWWMLPVPILGTVWGCIVSHPHGTSKHVSFGKVLRVNSWLREQTLNYVYRLRHCKRRLLCRLPPNTHNDATPLPQQQQKTPALMEPGQTYKLPDETKFSLPGDISLSMYDDDQGFASQIRMDEKRDWVTLPPKTVLTFPNGNTRYLQHETELYLPLYTKIPLICYLTYSIPTCPGSSGARLIYRKNLPYLSVPHWGAAESDTNASGVGMFPSISLPDNTDRIHRILNALVKG